MSPPWGKRTEALAKRVRDLGFEFDRRFLPPSFIGYWYVPVYQYGVGIKVHARTFWSFFSTLKELDSWVSRMEAELSTRLTSSL